MALSGLPQKWLINYRVGLKQTEKKRKKKDWGQGLLRFGPFRFGKLFICLFPDGHSRWAIFASYTYPVLHATKICIARVPDFLIEKDKKKPKEKKIHLENEIITAFSLGDLSQRGVLVKTTKKKIFRRKTGNQTSHDSNVKMLVDGFFFYLFDQTDINTLVLVLGVCVCKQIGKRPWHTTNTRVPLSLAVNITFLYLFIWLLL